jgi:hypothetical protein
VEEGDGRLGSDDDLVSPISVEVGGPGGDDGATKAVRPGPSNGPISPDDGHFGLADGQDLVRAIAIQVGHLHVGGAQGMGRPAGQLASIVVEGNGALGGQEHFLSSIAIQVEENHAPESVPHRMGPEELAVRPQDIEITGGQDASGGDEHLPGPVSLQVAGAQVGHPVGLDVEGPGCLSFGPPEGHLPLVCPGDDLSPAITVQVVYCQGHQVALDFDLPVGSDGHALFGEGRDSGKREEDEQRQRCRPRPWGPVSLLWFAFASHLIFPLSGEKV